MVQERAKREKNETPLQAVDDDVDGCGDDDDVVGCGDAAAFF